MALDTETYVGGMERLERIVDEMTAGGKEQEALFALARVLQGKMHCSPKSIPNSWAFDYIMRGVCSGIEDAGSEKQRTNYILRNIQQGHDGLLKWLPKE